MNDAKKENKQLAITATEKGIQIKSLDEMYRFAQYAVDGGFAPKGMNPVQAMVAIQYGLELGMTPLQGLSGIAVINGRPALWGDALTGVVRGSGFMEYYYDEEIGKPDTDEFGFRAVTKRKNDPKEIARTFTIGDAKKARLWGKAGPWTDYPKRMLMMRARSWCLRDAYPDALKGIVAAEEAIDTKQEPSRDAEYTTIGDATESLKSELGIEPAEIGVTDEHIDLIKARAFKKNMSNENAFEFACYVIGRRPKSWHELTAAEAENVLETLNDKETVERFTGANLAEQETLKI